MQPIITGNNLSQSTPAPQNTVTDKNQNVIDLHPVSADGGQKSHPEDTVTISSITANHARQTSTTVPSIPVTHAEMKALYKAFSVKI